MIKNSLPPLIYLGVALVITMCAGPKQQTVNQGYATLGNGGQIKSGKVYFNCTHPPRTYAREIEIKVKNSIDSLSEVPVSDMEVILATKVQKLTDYSSEGLDLALTQFYLCQMANNRALTSEQLYKLDSIAIKAWENIKTSKKETLRPEKNYKIQQEKISDSQFVVTATPIVGQWVRPYYAFSVNEYNDDTRPELIDKSNLGAETIISDGIIGKDANAIPVKVLFCRVMATPHYNYTLTMKKPVSKIYFGDWIDESQNFYLER